MGRPALYSTDPKPCAVCGLTMAPHERENPARFAKRQTCGVICGQVLARTRYPGRTPEPRIEKACAVCGLIFPQPADCPPSRFSRTRTCGDECRIELMARTKRRRVDEKRRECPVCHDLFGREEGEPAVQFSRRATCSPHCGAILGNKTRHVTFVYSSPYPPGWRVISRRIRKRDGGRCALRGAVRFLHAHHIDYQPANCRDDNLITLCRDCHTQTTFGDRFEWIAICQAILAERGIADLAD